MVAKKESGKEEDTKAGFSAVKFFQETKQELSKVVWPDRQQLVSESIAVVLMVTLSALLIYLVDRFFGWVSLQVFG